MRIFGALLLIAVLSSGLYFFPWADPQQEFRSSQRPMTVPLTVDPAAAQSDLPRIGMNLGTWTSWGAEQYGSNIVKNPGFEGLIDRAIAIVRQADTLSFSDDNEYLGRADGFWAGAEYDVRTGLSAGRRGTLSDSRQKDTDGYPRYISSTVLPPLLPGDVVALTRFKNDELPSKWWFPQESSSVVGVSSDVPAGSPGKRSVVLKPAPGREAVLHTYFDAIGSRAGKMLPLQGPWRLSFFSRQGPGDSRLEVELRREGAPPMLQRTLEPSRSWARTNLEFSASDDGPDGTLQLHFQATGSGEVLLDDVELTAAGADSPFRRELTEALARLQPGYLRDWQGQLGDTLENRLASPLARVPSRYRPGVEEAKYFYSLPEFLDLCSRLHARPWIVVPPTFSDEENLAFGRFLANQADTSRFDEVLVEFGNENWNSIFRPAGIPNPEAHAQAFQRAFYRIRQGAGSSVRLISVANGQYVYPSYALDVAGHALPDMLAVAPYFLHRLEAGTGRAERLAQLFARDSFGQMLATGMEKMGRSLGVYEVNLHTTEGSASAAERDATIAGMASGSALARRILESLAWGMKRQCVYVLAGFDTYLAQNKQYTRLWGVVRDLGSTRRFRPTGLAVGLLNQVIGGDRHRIPIPEYLPEVTAAAFHQNRKWSAALVSSASQPITVTLEFPPSADSLYPNRILRLEASDPEASNEESEEVRIAAEPVLPAGNKLKLRLPAYGLAVLTSDP